MISFRYHVVTIVAVFLALAIGLLAGSAFVQPALQGELEDQTAELRRANADLREQVGELRSELGSFDDFADAALPRLTENRLIGTNVVVVSQEGVEDTVLAQAQRSLVDSGAEVVAVLSAREELASEDADTQRRLAEILEASDASPVDLPSLAAAALAERLALGNGTGDPSEDLLNRLLSEGFLAPVGPGLSEAALERIGAPGQVVVVLGGASVETPLLMPEAFALPLVRSLESMDVPVAAGESASTPVPFVGLVRDGEDDGTVTVDDLDVSMGGAALVLGIEELLDSGQGGAYGFKDGAEPLPPIP